MGTSRQRSLRSLTTMSEPPVEAPAANTAPSPNPHSVPPYSAPISGSVAGMGIRAKTSIRAELHSIPVREPKKNRRPIFTPAMRNRGRLMSTLRLPTLPNRSSSTATSARPEIPPGLISLGMRKQEKPKANRALPRIVTANQPKVLRKWFILKPQRIAACPRNPLPSAAFRRRGWSWCGSVLDLRCRCFPAVPRFAAPPSF